MVLSTNPTFYCLACEGECKPILQTEEAYPGQYVTIFLSDCCHEEIVDWNSRPIPYGILRRRYDEAKSYQF